MKPVNSITTEIVTARQQRKLSQAEMARRAGIPLRTYQRLESDAKGLKLDTLIRALDALGLTIRTASKRRPVLEELDDLYGNE